MLHPLVVTGSRSITDRALVASVLAEFTNYVLYVGDATGVDRLAFAIAMREHIPIRLFPANWARYGRWAGIARNKEMVELAGFWGGRLIALWDGRSRGTKQCFDYAQKRRVPAQVRVLASCEQQSLF